MYDRAMEIREFFIIAFGEDQALGEQSAEAAQHLTVLGYLRPKPRAVQQFSISEHVERIALKRLELPGKKLKKLGQQMVTLLDDPTEELTSAKDQLLSAILADGYICTRPDFYTERFKPHVSMGPALSPDGRQPSYRKLQSFELHSLSVTESRFDLNYQFLGADLLSTRSL